jgi:hypothetical protein
MCEVLEKARGFIMSNARLLERRLYEVRFEGLSPEYAGRVVKAYQNPDGGLGHALEPDERCPSSQPLFVSFGLVAMEEAGYRDTEFALSLCDYLQSVADENGLVSFFTENVFDYPVAGHWVNSSIAAVSILQRKYAVCCITRAWSMNGFRRRLRPAVTCL